MRTLLVGLDNPHSGNPHHALYPIPERATGGRIVNLIKGVVDDYGPREYLRDFYRCNLYPTRRAPEGKGRVAADRDAVGHVMVLADSIAANDVVLLGVRGVDAFNITYGAKLDWLRSHTMTVPLVRVWALPHPSGRNYWYNDPHNRRAAGTLLAKLRRRQMMPYGPKELAEAQGDLDAVQD